MAIRNGDIGRYGGIYDPNRRLTSELTFDALESYSEPDMNCKTRSHAFSLTISSSSSTYSSSFRKAKLSIQIHHDSLNIAVSRLLSCRHGEGKDVNPGENAQGHKRLY